MFFGNEHSVACGGSEKRNLEYSKNFTPQKFFSEILAGQAPTIFDVGAHRGESLAFFKAIYPEAKVFSFEPNPSEFEFLSEVAEGYNDVEVFDFAIGEKVGVAQFFRQDDSHLGSLLRVNVDSTDSLGYAKNARNESIDVRVETIDSFCQQFGLDEIALLKIDVQGAEVQVLKGAKRMLRRTQAVSVEVSLFDFYEKFSSSPVLEIERLMCDGGLDLWDISKLSKNPENLRTEWFEAVYRKSRTSTESGATSGQFVQRAPL